MELIEPVSEAETDEAVNALLHEYVLSLGLLWLSLMSLASQAYNPFIYFRF